MHVPVACHPRATGTQRACLGAWRCAELQDKDLASVAAFGAQLLCLRIVPFMDLARTRRQETTRTLMCACSAGGLTWQDEKFSGKARLHSPGIGMGISLKINSIEKDDEDKRSGETGMLSSCLFSAEIQ